LAPGQSAKAKLPQARAAADIFAREAADLKWSPAHTESILKTLENCGADFKKPETFPEQHARRAERLILALDRFYRPQAGSAADDTLKTLFALAQSVPDFKPALFAAALDDFARARASQSSALRPQSLAK
jgi:hypothetical protein